MSHKGKAQAKYNNTRYVDSDHDDDDEEKSVSASDYNTYSDRSSVISEDVKVVKSSQRKNERHHGDKKCCCCIPCPPHPKPDPIPCCEKVDILVDKLCGAYDKAKALNDSLKEIEYIANSTWARAYAENINSNCQDRDMSVNILGAAFLRTGSSNGPCGPCNTSPLDKANAFAVEIRNHHPFDVAILPYVIFANIDSGKKYAFPYLNANLFPSIDTILPLTTVNSQLNGGLFRVPGTAKIRTYGSTGVAGDYAMGLYGPLAPDYSEDCAILPISSNYVVPQIGLIAGVPNLFTQNNLPNGDYVATVAFLGWTYEWPLGRNNDDDDDAWDNVRPFIKQWAFLGWVMSATMPSIIRFTSEQGSGLYAQLPWPIFGSNDLLTVSTASSGSRSANTAQDAKNTLDSYKKAQRALNVAKALQFPNSQFQKDSMPAISMMLI